MADDFQSQCPYCNNTGIETHYKGIPELEQDDICSCGRMTRIEYIEKLEREYIIARQKTDNLFAELKAKGIDVVKSVKGIENELQNRR